MKAWTLLTLALAAAPAVAQPVHAVRPLDGYTCASLQQSTREAMDPKGGVPIRSAPQAGAPVDTLASSVLLVKQPRHEVGGYVEVMQLNGRTGWIEQGRVKPFDPLARCVPSVMSNNRPGFG